MAKARRTVTTSARVKRGAKGGRHPALWAYGYEDIATAVGKSVAAVRADAMRRRFAPTELASVAGYVLRGGKRDPVLRMLKRVLEEAPSIGIELRREAEVLIARAAPLGLRRKHEREHF